MACIDSSSSSSNIDEMSVKTEFITNGKEMHSTQYNLVGYMPAQNLIQRPSFLTSKTGLVMKKMQLLIWRRLIRFCKSHPSHNANSKHDPP